MADIRGARRRFSTWMADEFRPAALVSSFFSGLLIYILEIVFVISFGALVFSGSLASALPEALGFIIIGDALLLAIISLFSSYPGTIGASQDTPGAVMGLVGASIVAALAASTAAQQFATVVMMIVLTTLMTGVLFLSLGLFRLGGLARFLPYPVMGGFLAGTGWLLASGGVIVMTGTRFSRESFTPAVLVHWLPGVLLGLVIFLVASRLRNPLTVPALLAVGGLAFYAVARVMNVSIAELQAEGWLVGSMSGGSFHFPFSAEVLSQVNWTVLLDQIPNLLPAAIISVIALLLNSGGLELMIKRDIDLNRELVVAGAGNLSVGLLGGLVGFHTISLSALNHQGGGGRRLTGVIAALSLVVTVFIGASFVGYIPKLVFGAVLVYLGAALLYEWVYEAWFKFPRLDIAIILSILGVVIFSSFLTGVIVGLVLAIILFVVSYSQVNVVRFALSWREYRSRVTRSLQEQQVLDVHGDRIYILKLQGFIFFGTASRIFDRVRRGVKPAPAGARRYVLLDFGLVSGLDSTGLLSFTRMLQWGREQNVVLILTGLKGQAHEQFTNGGFGEQTGSLYFFLDLDRGMEWCENDILAGALTGERAQLDLAAQLRPLARDDIDLEKLVRRMRRCEYAPGDYVIRQGDDADQIYFVESGQVTAQLEVPGQLPMRLETMGGGRCVGELAFYMGIKRTAAVIAVQPSVLYALSMQELAEIERTDPVAADLFHRIVIRLLGERVRNMNRVLDALER